MPKAMTPAKLSPSVGSQAWEAAVTRRPGMNSRAWAWGALSYGLGGGGRGGGGNIGIA